MNPQAGGRRDKDRRKKILIAALSAVVATGAFVLATNHQTNTPGTGGTPAPVATERAVVALKDLPAYSKIDADSIEISTVSVSTVPEGSSVFTDPAKVTGQFIAVSVAKGQVILSSYVIAGNAPVATPGPGGAAPVAGAPAAPLLLADGHVAISMPIDDQLGVGGWVRQGDHIDIIIVETLVDPKVGCPAGALPSATCQTHNYALQDVPVLRVGAATSQGVDATLLVLDLPREKALVLANVLDTPSASFGGINPANGTVAVRIVLRAASQNNKGVAPSSVPVGPTNARGFLDS